MASSQRILVIGREGQVALALRAILPAPKVEVIAVGRPDVDLLQAETAASAVRAVRPTLVVVPAAYTAVDRAEDEADAARAINAEAPGIIAAAAADVGAPIVHFSTDYVFDGCKATPYREDDATAPLGVYGTSKLAGEQAVARANPRHVIVRTAWVCSPTGSNFVKTMLRLAAERPSLRVVADQHGAPTFAVDLARAVATISRRLHDDAEADRDEHWGVFHLASQGVTTWHGFAEAIIDGSARRGGRHVPVDAITTSEFPTRARRPAYSKLATDKIERVYGVAMPDWRAGLDACLDTLIGPALDQGKAS